MACDTRELAWAIRAVLPHVSHAPELPELCAVRIEAAPGVVYAVAMDRYTFAAAWAGAMLDGVPDGRWPGALLATADARELLRRLRAAGDGTTELAWYDDGELAVDYRVRYAPACTWPEFPDWRKLARDILADQPEMPGPCSGLRPDYLARFTAAVHPANVHRTLSFTRVRRGAGRNWPALVLGPQFLGAVMDVRMPDEPDLLSGGAYEPPSLTRENWAGRVAADAGPDAPWPADDRARGIIARCREDRAAGDPA